MIARDVTEERTILIRQEDHADLSAQFASHWGNARFARLEPYETMVFAAIYHDTQFRDVEADLPIDSEAGRPHGHRTVPFSPKHLEALRNNIDWVKSRDPYAALIVSMHHTGLPQGRYGVINSWQTSPAGAAPKRAMRPEVAANVKELEEEQRAALQELGRQDAGAEATLRFNYRMMQVFDLLSLYFCCDGHGKDGMKETRIGPVPVAYGSDQEVDLHILPAGANTVRLDPYPFDVAPLEVCVPARTVRKLAGHSEAECRTAFYNAPRENLTWTITK